MSLKNIMDLFEKKYNLVVVSAIINVGNMRLPIAGLPC